MVGASVSGSEVSSDDRACARESLSARPAVCPCAERRHQLRRRPPGPVARTPTRRRRSLNALTLPQHRPVPHRGVGHRRSRCRTRRRASTSTRFTRRRGAAGCGRPTNNGVTWDAGHPTASTSRRSAPSPSRRRIRSVVWIGTGDQANARSSYLGQGRLQVHRRRRRPGSSWACPTRITSRAS